MSGVYGADVAYPTSVAQWQTLMQQNGVTFGIVRCYESVGQVDPNAAASINAGWAAGLSRVDVYHFPCVSVGAEAQVQAVVQALSAANVKIGYYWIDVEQGAGWSTTNFASNSQFLSQLIQAAQNAGLTVGIYTSPGEWPQVINNSQFAQYPLWYAAYDNQASFADFAEFGNFGGWTQPVMKQYAGDLTSGSTSYDANWAPSLPPLSASNTTQSSPPPAPASSSSSASTVRSNVTTYATSIVGNSAASSYAEYVSIIAPGETMTTQQSMATESSCGLTVAGIWRACGLYNSQLNAPYVNGTALSRLVAIGQACGGYQAYSLGMLPNPGDMVLIGNNENASQCQHVYTVISVNNQGSGNAVIQSVDGGQGSGGTAIGNNTHTWSGGYDTDAYYPNRQIMAIINVTKVITSSQMPLAGFVQAAPPGTSGVDCMSAISSQVASAIVSGKYGFCIRYISPNETNVTALTATEAQSILSAGLGLMLTQRINAASLAFSASLGTQHGQAAAQSAVTIGIPMCANLWLLLDNIPAGTSATNMISYYNAWYTAVYNAGFLPGLCVGPTEVLNAGQLGDALSFGHYWQSAGVTVSPTPRGYQLVEGSAVTVGGVSMNSVTAQNDQGISGSPQGPGQAQWLIANP